MSRKQQNQGDYSMDVFSLTMSGRLGKDPELTYTDDGVAICKFSLAHQSRKDSTTWYRVTTFRGLAEKCAQFLATGSRVVVTINREVDCKIWEKRDGSSEISRDVVANEVVFMDAKKSAANEDEDEPGF